MAENENENTVSKGFIWMFILTWGWLILIALLALVWGFDALLIVHTLAFTNEGGCGFVWLIVSGMIDFAVYCGFYMFFGKYTTVILMLFCPIATFICAVAHNERSTANTFIVPYWGYFFMFVIIDIALFVLSYWINTSKKHHSDLEDGE